MGLTEASQEKLHTGITDNVRISDSYPEWRSPESGRRDAVHQYATGLAGISDASWLPPSRWDNGIPGLLLTTTSTGQ